MVNVSNSCVEACAATKVVTSAPDRDVVIQRTLHAARAHLGLDIAFVSQFIGGDRVFRYVDAASEVSCVQVGTRDPLEESYCQYVVDGSLPQLLADPGKHPVSARLAVTTALGVGTHVSVPIHLSDGRVYGTFCCFGFEVTTSVEPRDLLAVRMLAQVVAGYVEELDVEERDRRRRRDEITALLDDPSAITMLFQPLVGLATGDIVAVEALARFASTGRGPDTIFSQGWEAGLGVDLELKAVRAALDHLKQLPECMQLSVNASAATLVSDEFSAIVRLVPAGRLTVEVTEHTAVDDYRALGVVRQRLSSAGIRLAIDDVGMGVSGLNHILQIGPDAIKIDAVVVRDVHNSPGKAAMIEALVSFGERTGVVVVAEGIETADELATLRSLGVGVGQGYHLGRPAELTAIIAEHPRSAAPLRWSGARPRSGLPREPTENAPLV